MQEERDIVLNIKSTTGKEFEIKIKNTSSVSDLKYKISRFLKMPKEKLTLLHKNSQIQWGTLRDHEIVEHSKITITPHVETGFAAGTQNTEQSIVQAIEGLSDQQIDEFLSGRAPLTLALRVDDHMMFVQLQLEQPKSLPKNKNGSLQIQTTTTASKTLVQPGACINTFVKHGPGVFSGTFSGSLHPSIQDENGKPKRDPQTILQILNDLLAATQNYQGPNQPGHVISSSQFQLHQHKKVQKQQISKPNNANLLAQIQHANMINSQMYQQNYLPFNFTLAPNLNPKVFADLQKKSKTVKKVPKKSKTKVQKSSKKVKKIVVKPVRQSARLKEKQIKKEILRKQKEKEEQDRLEKERLKKQKELEEQAKQIQQQIKLHQSYQPFMNMRYPFMRFSPTMENEPVPDHPKKVFAPVFGKNLQNAQTRVEINPKLQFKPSVGEPMAQPQKNTANTIKPQTGQVPKKLNPSNKAKKPKPAAPKPAQNPFAMPMLQPIYHPYMFNPQMLQQMKNQRQNLSQLGFYPLYSPYMAPNYFAYQNQLFQQQQQALLEQALKANRSSPVNTPGNSVPKPAQQQQQIFPNLLPSYPLLAPHVFSPFGQVPPQKVSKNAANPQQAFLQQQHEMAQHFARNQALAWNQHIAQMQAEWNIKRPCTTGSPSLELPKQRVRKENSTDLQNAQTKAKVVYLRSMLENQKKRKQERLARKRKKMLEKCKNEKVLKTIQKMAEDSKNIVETQTAENFKIFESIPSPGSRRSIVFMENNNSGDEIQIPTSPAVPSAK